MSKGTGKKLVIGTLVAGAAGYIAGILTAPKSGKETRQDIKSAASKAMLHAEKQLKNLHGELDTLLALAKTRATSLSEKGKSELGDLAQKAVKAKEQVREMLSAIHEGDADDPDLSAAVKNAREASKALGKYLKKNAS